ncbi:MAG: protein translocase subunit SecDF, partial [Alistipes sp.]|nr:protein translocase subunit SecDF [Alistipes sp.]
MQSKGAVKLFTILLVIGCIYQLSFSFITRGVEKKAAAYAAAYDESEQSVREAYYLDSVQNQPVFSLLGLKDFTYKECKEKEVNLGLDLKGGMNVMLEIEVQDLVKSLAGESQNDPAFVAAIEKANEALKAGTDDYIGEFAKAYVETSNGGSLATIFVSPDRQDITPNSTNDEVLKVLRDETDAAIAASFNILRSRIDHFGVTQPNIQRLPNSNRILVELPGVKEPERVRKLLQGSASLEFWVTYTTDEILPILAEADALIKQSTEAPAEEQAAEATAEAASDLVSEVANAATTEESVEGTSRFSREQNPLFALLDPSYSGGAIVGAAAAADMPAINEYLARPEIQNLFPADLQLKWGIKGEEMFGGRFALYALRAVDGKPAMDGSAVSTAQEQYSERSA